MKKQNVKKRLMRNTTSIMSILVTALLIFSSAVASISINEQGEIKINEKEGDLQEPDITASPSSGLAPHTINNDPYGSSQLRVDGNYIPLGIDEEYMWGYNAYTGSGGMNEGPVYFELENPGDITFLQDTASGAFLSGGTYTNEETWVGCEYYTGALWTIDPETGDMESIGGGGTGLNGLAYNPTDNVLYGAAGSGLYIIDYETGEQEFVGSFGVTTLMIGIAFDSEGTLYAWSILPDSLYICDTETGECTEVGPLGININYAQDGHFDMEADILYLSAYTSSGGLYTCDKETGECELVGGFQGGAEITASMIPYVAVKPEHDVGIKSINYPESGYATADMPMQVTVKNYGNNTEVTDVQMNIIRCEGEGMFFVDENFSGETFPPENWTTDWWESSDTSVAGGEVPEAMCDRTVQWAAYDYYDNYIMSPQVNCSGWEKVNLRFAFSADINRPSYNYLYLRYRKNSTSSWKDLTPWENPIQEDFTDWFEIGCYGFEADLGDEFQFKFEFLGYAYYFDYWYLDDVTLEGCGGCAEYSSIIEDVTVPFDGTVDIDFPPWTPSEWQNESTENTYQEYPLQAFTLLDDDKERNNNKWKLIEIYFPWMDDVGAVDLQGPESGPAQTFPLTGQIKNWGQNEECCFNTHVMIQEVSFDNPVTIWTEDFEMASGYNPPPGWSKGGSYMYAWYFGFYEYYLPQPYGQNRMPYLYYYYAGGAELISPEIDTTSVGAMYFELGTYIWWYSGKGASLTVQIRPDPNTEWIDISPWENPITENVGPDWFNADATAGIGTQTQLRFSFKGVYTDFRYWFLDNCKLVGYDVTEPEFETYACTQSIIPGETLDIDFGDWTPEFLAEEMTGTKQYSIRMWTNLVDPEDKNVRNDLISKRIELEFFHDVHVQEITSPSKGRGDEVIFSQVPIAPGQGHGPFSDAGTNYRCYENFWELTQNIGMVHWWGLCGYGSGQPTEGDEFEIAFCEDDNGIPDHNNHLYEFDGALGTEITYVGTGDFYFGYELFYFVMELPDFVDMAEGWVSFYKTNVNAQVFAMIDAEIGSGDGQAYQKGVGTILYDLAFELVAGGPSVYVALGTQNIDAIVENIGTFPELDLTCSAEIYEYITNCTVGTLDYEDMITDIDLEEPLGGAEALSYDSYDFAFEGVYELIFNLSAENDDYPKNNVRTLMIGADDTPPVSDHTINPATPDGDNGWYVNDVEVTLTAVDPGIGCEQPGSDVKEIKYKVGDGSWQSIPGGMGTFVIDVDADDLLIQYYAIDNVGKVESTNSFTIDMDQTIPDIAEVTWEAFQDPPITGLWYVTFTCDATDETSIMDRVEFFINDGEHEIVVDVGPIYTFTIEWSEAFKKHTFWFYHYDTAGNMIEDNVLGEGIDSLAYYQQQSIQQYQMSKMTYQ